MPQTVGGLEIGNLKLMRKKIAITPNLESLFGNRDENLILIEDGLDVTINLRSDGVEIEGAAENVARAEQIFGDFEHLRRTGYTFHNEIGRAHV